MKWVTPERPNIDRIVYYGGRFFVQRQVSGGAA